MNSERKTQEFWYARELQEVLDYSQWRRFKDVIEKAMDSCEASGNMVEDHFANVGKMVSIGSSAEREVEDFHNVPFQATFSEFFPVK